MRMRFLISCLAVLSLCWSHPVAGQERAPRSAKINPLLANALDRIHGAGVTRSTMGGYDLEQFSTPQVRVDRQGLVHVYIYVHQLDDAAVKELQSAGVTVEITSPQHRIVQGWIPFDQVESLAALANVKRIRPPDYAVPRSRIKGTRSRR